MNFEMLRRDLEAYQGHPSCTVDEALGLIQDLCKDVKQETGTSVIDSDVRDLDDLIKRLNWLGNFTIGIYDKLSGDIAQDRRAKRAEEIKASLSEITQQWENLEQNLQELRGQCAAQKREKEALEEDIKRVQAEYEMLQDQVLKCRDSVKANQQKYDAADNEIKNLQTQNMELQKSLKHMVELKEEAKKENQELAIEKDALEKANDQFCKGPLAKSKEAYEKVLKENEELRMKLEAKERVQLEVAGRNDEIREKLEKVLSDIQEKESQYGIICEMHGINEKKLKEIQDKEQDAMKEKKQLDVQIESAQQELRRIKSQTDRLVTQELPGIRGEVEKGKKQKQSLTEEKTRLSEVLSKVLGQIEELNAQLEVLAQQKEEAEQRAMEASEQKSLWETELAKVQEKAKELDESVSKLIEERKKMEEDIEKKNYNGICQELGQKIQELAQLREKYDMDEQQLSVTKNDIQKIKEKTIDLVKKQEECSKELKKETDKKLEAELELKRLEEVLASLANTEYIQKTKQVADRLDRLKNIRDRLHEDSVLMHNAGKADKPFDSGDEIRIILHEMGDRLNSVQKTMNEYRGYVQDIFREKG